MSSNDELLFGDDAWPLIPELFSIDPLGIIQQNDEITLLRARIERLNIEVHTRNLQVEVERVKRQNFRTKLKRVKREMIPLLPNSS